ncbi:MAG: hypothetical protein AAFR17_11540 [Pseudomonadota bacterium]
MTAESSDPADLSRLGFRGGSQRSGTVVQDEMARLLDRAYIDNLVRHLGLDLATELLADGMIAVSDRLERLSSARDATPDTLAKLAHDLTGASGQIGLHVLLHATRRLENAAIGSDRMAMHGLVDEALREGSLSLAALGDYLAEEAEAGRAKSA